MANPTTFRSGSSMQSIPKQQNDPFTTTEIKQLCQSSFTQGFDEDRRQAAICMVLRYGAHSDGMHDNTSTPGGLHPTYTLFTPQDKLDKKFSRTTLVEDALTDVFDAITIQDRLDGGFSVLIHCPGSEAGLNLTPDKITTDLYVTPRELASNKRIKGDTAVLVQAFCEEFALPYLHHFNHRCTIEAIQPPKLQLPPAEKINLSGPDYIPDTPNLSVRIQCSAVGSTTKATLDSHSASAAIHKAAAMASTKSITTPWSTSISQQSVRQCQPADAFLHEIPNNLLEPSSLPFKTQPFVPLVFPDDTQPFTPLISIGPNTDAMLDCFKLGMSYYHAYGISLELCGVVIGKQF